MQVADYSAPFSSNFLASLLVLGRRLRDAMGLESVFVFPASASERPWVKDLEAAGYRLRFLDTDASHGDKVRALVRVGKETGAVLLHTHFGFFDVDAARAAHRIGCASVWHMHSPYPIHGTLRKRLGERAKFQIGARLRVDRIIAVSHNVAASAIAHGGPRDKLIVVLNGIDAARVRIRGADRFALRRERGIPDEATVFLAFGWSPARKGVDLVVRASVQLERRARTSFVCLVVGGEGEQPELEALVRGVHTIRVVPPVPDVSELYAISDCLVSPSRAEGLPYAVGEAMAARLPVIASDLPQVVEAYGPAGPGVITVPSGDPSALAEAMDRILSSPPDERSRLGAANAAYVDAHMSLDRWADEILDVYRAILHV